MTTTLPKPTRADELAEAQKRLAHWIAGPCLPGCFSPFLQALSDRYEQQRSEIVALLDHQEEATL